MGKESNISWTSSTWNCLYGCARVSPGCTNCYAETHCHRFSGPGQIHEGLTVLGKKGPRWTGKIQIAYHRLFEPMKWTRSRMIFCNSLSDVWHKDVPKQYIQAMFGVMAACDHHIFQVLTKRADLMEAWYASGAADIFDCTEAASYWLDLCVQEGHISEGVAKKYLVRLSRAAMKAPFPLKNVWVGVSTENQETFDERVPHLSRVPAAVRWISAEPLLGPLDITSWYDSTHLDWIVVGGESGPRARGMEYSWAERVVQDAQAIRIPVHMKQLGTVLAKRFPGSGKKGEKIEWFPREIRAREYPAQLQ